MKEEIFNTTPADYEGTNSDTYGSITSTSTTDSSGVATSIYTAGVKAGFIEFWWEERSVKKAKRGSFFLLWPFGKERWGKEKLKLRVYVGEIPEGYEPPLRLSDVKNYIKDSFDFVVSKNRFEWVDTQFTNCNENEFNVLNTYRAGFGLGEVGFYEGRERCLVNYVKIVELYYDRYSERAGRTAAHEMGHSISGHHENCIMIPNPTDLPSNCQHFCNECQNKWWSKNLGGE